VGTIEQGQRVRVQLDATEKRDVEGRVVEISPAADPATRSYVVKIELPPGLNLRSGLFGRAFFRAGEREVLAVPRKAIVERGQLRGVYALDQANVTHFRLITTGTQEGDVVEVLSGLNRGERIVVEGVERVADGSRVE
jgi:RND family efflux transporter MFP subunit